MTNYDPEMLNETLSNLVLAYGIEGAEDKIKKNTIPYSLKIAMLSNLCEKYNIWGTSSLTNEQEKDFKNIVDNY